MREQVCSNHLSRVLVISRSVVVETVLLYESQRDSMIILNWKQMNKNCEIKRVEHNKRSSILLIEFLRSRTSNFEECVPEHSFRIVLESD